MAQQLRPYQRHEIYRLLAEGKMTQKEIAERYGVTPQAISHLSIQEAARIQTIREDFENEFAGMWIANKKARIAELENDASVAGRLVEYFTDQILTPTSSTPIGASGSTPTPSTAPHGSARGAYGASSADADNANVVNQLIRTRERVMRSAAEEMGAIPSKVQITVNPVQVDYTLNGVEPENDV